MNIYIQVEISSRELDSKLLLATLAASKGHNVLVSSSPEIIKGLKNGLLNPGVFHTKSLTPSKTKIQRHQEIIDNNSVITSIDEEAIINIDGYDQFAIDRYSEISIAQSSAVFGWGDQDVDSLKAKYPTVASKIYKTGSPRVDLWKPSFSKYWKNPKDMPKKPYLLISSTIFVTSVRPFHEGVKLNYAAGYFERDPELFKRNFYSMSDDYRKLYVFIDAIKHLAKNSNGYDIVVRPHPVENIEAWKIFLKNVQNVHVIRNDSITAWVKNSFAVMHSACTTGIEASISGVPVLSYNHPELQQDKEILSNQLGYSINSKAELLEKVKELFKLKFTKKKNNNKLEVPSVISKKVYIDNQELAAEKIIKVWESFSQELLSQPNNWIKFYCYLKIINLKPLFRNFMNKLFPKVFKSKNDNHKFPPIEGNDIKKRVKRFENLLGIKTKIKCQILSERTIIIKKVI